MSNLLVTIKLGKLKTQYSAESNIMKFRTLFALSISLLLLGCANQRHNTQTQFVSYSDFRPGPENGVDLVWASPEIRSIADFRQTIANYDSVILDNIYVVIDEKTNDLTDNQINEITQYAKQQLTMRISKYKKIVSIPTETTLRISFALSNVETPNPILAFTSTVLPIGLGISAISKITTGEHSNVGKATAELLISDAITNKPIAAAIDSQAGEKDFSTMIDSLDDSKDAINYWIERLIHSFKAAYQ